MQFLIITGMSGAGKSHCVKYFEDIGFYCVDNLPPSLIPTFAMLSRQSGNMEKIALIVDIRGGEMFKELFPALEQLTMLEIPYRILFLDASDEVLIKRFKETRRMHPLAQEGRVQDGITQEREILRPVRARADVLLDTSNMLPRQLREAIVRQFVEGRVHTGLTVNIRSFGFKYGLPLDADLVFDVRFIPNPYYIDNLKPLTGLDVAVSDYVMAQPESVTFLDKLMDMVLFLMPHYVKEGKSQLVIAIGCTGGKHRSVTLACRLGSLLEAIDTTVVLEHRDIDRDGKAGGS